MLHVTLVCLPVLAVVLVLEGVLVKKNNISTIGLLVLLH